LRNFDEGKMAQKAIAAMAEMLLDCAAYRHEVSGVEPSNKDESQRTAIDHFEKKIADREYQAFQNMVVAYKFKPELLERTTGSEDRETLWKHDLFGKEIQRHLGIGLAAGAAAGAVTGMTADLLFFGHALGLPTTLGVVTGAIAGALGAGLYNNKFDRSLNTITIQSTEKTCRVLIERALLLLKSLQHRGMADQRDFVVSDKALRGVKADVNNLLAELADAAKRPSVSMIGVDPEAVSKQVLAERKDRVTKIEGLIETLASKAEDAAR
jgi:uncharacterized membrane protein